MFNIKNGKIGIKFDELILTQKLFINKNVYKYKMEVILALYPKYEDLKELYEGYNYFIVVKYGVLFVFYSQEAYLDLKYKFDHALSAKVTEVDKFYILRCLEGIDKNSIIFDKKVIRFFLSNKKLNF